MTGGAARAASGPVSFLIVDDDLGDRKALRRLLAAVCPGSTQAEAGSVAAALERMSERRFDLVFLDHNLPGGDGVSALGRLGAACSDTAFVMVTGQGSEEIAAEALKHGAVDYIAKRQLSAASVGRLVGTALDRVALRRKLDAHVEELTRFAHVLVHDIRAPIRHLQFLCEEFEDGLRAGETERALADARDIHGTCARMDALITSLARHIEVNAAIRLAPVDPGAVLAEVLQDLSVTIAEAGADVAAEPMPPVMADRALLARLFQNLVSNAIKYCRGGRPTVRVTATEDGDGMARLSVRDNGIGIAPEFLEVIFEPFRRLHAEGVFDGSGLGLATSAKIVERHGGRLWAESEPGAGSVFRFTLPAAKGASGVDAKRSALPA